jgi:hypothetical protein
MATYYSISNLMKCDIKYLKNNCLKTLAKQIHTNIIPYAQVVGSLMHATMHFNPITLK